MDFDGLTKMNHGCPIPLANPSSRVTFGFQSEISNIENIDSRIILRIFSNICSVAIRLSAKMKSTPYFVPILEKQARYSSPV